MEDGQYEAQLMNNPVQAQVFQPTQLTSSFLSSEPSSSSFPSARQWLKHFAPVYSPWQKESVNQEVSTQHENI